ncbi:NnrS family protein [Methylomarinum sp. Ch1-1]|uniref:NnrS family protein n=1 Tax=Methylomarinum roseum TaxID=3067653 RepID=A0AAU7NQ62_9GAMM|nr:NnrS family protein [Methylomarinum sp. Ch1-1]MDP4520963.1 NnrS family protein [Methylomarinum sp. Ch1-1]
MNKKPVFNYPLFAMGFRAFFTLAGLSALLLIAAWTSIFDGSLKTDNYFASVYWHAHEMLLGYSVAVIAGFLLTAVRNWTGIETITYDKLAALFLLWIYGRIVPFYSELLPDLLIAAIDFAFLPLLVYYISVPILKAGNYKNLIFSALLLLLAVGNALVHAEILGFSENTAWLGLNIVVAVIIGMILVIAGRIFPYFTERGLSGVIAIRNPLLDMLSVAAAIVAFILVIAGVSGGYLLAAALLALGLNVVRAVGWYDARIWFVPLLWVLYVGYAWIMLGFIMLALAAYQIVPFSLAMHAFTVGGIGVLTLGMMARVSLGHSGRALRVSNMLALAFVLINVAALFRALLPALMPDWYGGLLIASTYCWLAAFSLFVLHSYPILTEPRPDGREG